ncbi:MAG: hypothetical protein K0Q59_2525 [Paenibacillus sp.]|jgi:hypothetical protein|nr:hypothetical protein [Paenibacillus sp.]
MTFTDENPMFYRFEGLLLAIEFFTQRFDTEQLAQFSFEFVNEILTLNASALFIREGETFVMKQKRLYSGIHEYVIRDTDKLKRLVTFRGHTILDNFHHFLEEEDIARLNIRWLMPLMIVDRLHGFIVSSGNMSDRFTHDDEVMSNTLMRLIGNSLENSRHLAELQMSNAKLDQKNFNLFAINQSTRALMSETSLAKLHETATDVFSEVTASQVTSFGIVDPLTQRLNITGYRDVSTYAKYYGALQLRSPEYSGPIVLHVDRDRERLSEVFVNSEQLAELAAEYIILIVQQRIIGMVTLSKPINDERKHDDSIFELIESLANATLIAISNAVQFEEANRQRIDAQNKLRLLQTLHRSIKTMSECAEPEELCYFAIKTVQLAFGARKALICLKDGDRYKVTESLGWEERENEAKRPGTGAPSPFSHDFRATVPVKGKVVLNVAELQETLLEGTMVADFTNLGASRLLPPETSSWIGETNCCVIAPLAIADKVTLHHDPSPLGLLILLETADALKEEETLLVDTVASSIAPVLHHMRIAASWREQAEQAQNAL